jgi:phage gp46-like protein
MSDLTTSWDPALLAGDWIFSDGDLASGRDLETAVVISLFTDRLAHDDDPLPDPGDSDRRGWWADWDAEAGPIGSRLWLISREKQLEDVRLRAEDYCREALAWLIEDDVADTVEVTAAWSTAPGRLDLDVIIMRERAVLLHRAFSWAWRQIYAVR